MTIHYPLIYEILVKFQDGLMVPSHAYVLEKTFSLYALCLTSFIAEALSNTLQAMQDHIAVNQCAALSNFKTPKQHRCSAVSQKKSDLCHRHNQIVKRKAGPSFCLEMAFPSFRYGCSVDALRNIPSYNCKL